MNENKPSDPFPDSSELAAAVVAPRRRISIIWLVPIVAALIAAWLAYVAITEQGPRVTVSFDTAAGLEAGKTKVRFRDVDVGHVDTIRISDDNRSIITTIDFEKNAAKYLSETTKFWVVRARLDASGVTGLGTIFSGSYIEIEPGAAGKPLKNYIGLETPPVVAVDSPGTRYVLRSNSVSSLAPRTPIYFRGIRAGEVSGYQLTGDSRTIESHIFIKAPYDKLVLERTNFWNVGGVEVTAGADGFKVKVESLQALISGGLEFDSPVDLPNAQPAIAGAVFALYDSREAIGEAAITERIAYQLHFDANVRGLTVGSPVEFRGVRVGTVSNIQPQVNLVTNSIRIAVMIDIEPQRFGGAAQVVGEISQERYKLMAVLVEKGLRAQMQTASLLTGQQLVSLDFYPDEPQESLIRDGDMPPEIPTVPTTMAEITTTATRLLEKIEQLPFDVLVQDLRDAIGTLDDTLKETRTLVTTARGTLTPMMKDFQSAAVSARATMLQAETTIASLDQSVGETSEVRRTLAVMLRELADASRSIRQLADYLERNPDALVKGKSGP